MSSRAPAHAHGKGHVPSSSPPRASIAFELGPHPADPHSVVIPGSPVGVALGAGMGVGMMGMGMSMGMGAPPGAGRSGAVGGFEVPGADGRGNGHAARPGMPVPIPMPDVDGSGSGSSGGTACNQEAKGQELWVYAGSGG